MLLEDDVIRLMREEYFSRLAEPIKIIFFGCENEYCHIVEQLYSEISELSDKIIVLKKDEMLDGFVPAVILKSLNKGEIKFRGIPSGTEFPVFIETIVRISNGETGFTKRFEERVKKIDKHTDIKIFVTPSCPYCPKMVSTSYMFAMLNENIEAEAWEVTEFTDIKDRYEVLAAPKIVINDEVYFEGLVSPNKFLQNIRIALYPDEMEGAKLSSGQTSEV